MVSWENRSGVTRRKKMVHGKDRIGVTEKIAAYMQRENWKINFSFFFSLPHFSWSFKIFSYYYLQHFSTKLKSHLHPKLWNNFGFPKFCLWNIMYFYSICFRDRKKKSVSIISNNKTITVLFLKICVSNKTERYYIEIFIFF